MNIFFDFLTNLIFVLIFAFVYIFAVSTLKPLRYNKLRKASTLTLKISYLVYLAVFLIFVFFLFFFLDSEPEEQYFILHSVLLLFSIFFPNIGILIRRRMQNIRTQFNYTFATVNILVSLYLLYLLVINPWVFKF